MLEVGEVEDMFIPNPEDLLVNLDQSRNLVEDFLTMLPDAHDTSCHTQSALGAALQAAYKLMVGAGQGLGGIGFRIYCTCCMCYFRLFWVSCFN